MPVGAGNAVRIGDSGAAVTGYEPSINHLRERGRRGGRLDAGSQNTGQQVRKFNLRLRGFDVSFCSRFVAVVGFAAGNAIRSSVFPVDFFRPSPFGLQASKRRSGSCRFTHGGLALGEVHRGC